MKYINIFFEKGWRLIVVIAAALAAGGPFTIGFLLSKTKLETRIFVGMSFGILSLFFTPALSEVMLGPVYVALPEYAPTSKEVFHAAIAMGLLFNIGLLTGSFKDAMPGKFNFQGLEIPKRLVATLCIVWAIGVVLERSQILEASPSKKLVEITNDLESLPDEKKERLDRSLLNAWEGVSK